MLVHTTSCALSISSIVKRHIHKSQILKTFFKPINKSFITLVLQNVRIEMKLSEEQKFSSRLYTPLGDNYLSQAPYFKRSFNFNKEMRDQLVLFVLRKNLQKTCTKCENAPFTYLNCCIVYGVEIVVRMHQKSGSVIVFFIPIKYDST